MKFGPFVFLLLALSLAGASKPTGEANPTMKMDVAPTAGRGGAAGATLPSGVRKIAEGHLEGPGLVVADVIPNPPRTRLIRDAEMRGCIVLDGLGMLVSQGAISIRHWTGIDPEPKIMRKKLEHIFGV